MRRRIYRTICAVLAVNLLMAVPRVSYGSEETMQGAGALTQSEGDPGGNPDIDTGATTVPGADAGATGEDVQGAEQLPPVQDVQVESNTPGGTDMGDQEVLPSMPSEVQDGSKKADQMIVGEFHDTLPEIKEPGNIFPQTDSDAIRENHSDSYSGYSSNIIAGNELYLSELSLSYNLQFDQNFGSVMEDIEEDYKKFLDTPDNFRGENWQDVLAIYVMKHRSGTEEDVLVLDGLCRDDLEQLFFMMNLRRNSALLRKLETIRSGVSGENINDTGISGESQERESKDTSEGPEQFSTEASLPDQSLEDEGMFSSRNRSAMSDSSFEEPDGYQAVKEYYPLTVEDYITLYDVKSEDREILAKYTSDECGRLCAIVTAAKGFVRDSAGPNVSEDRVSIVAAACSLIGKVGYFWGGKSYATGWDSRWGSPMTVTASGSRSSGTVRSYGLDCSGFVAWAYYNGLSGRDVGIGNHTASQWNATQMIDPRLARPGDLVFYRPGSAGDDNHVGIVIAVNADGSLIVVHCSSSQNGVVTGEAWSSGFQYVRTPVNLE